jgi:hypothetical protein
MLILEVPYISVYMPQLVAYFQLSVIVTFLSPKNRELVVYVTFYHLKSLYLFVPMWFIGV